MLNPIYQSLFPGAVAILLAGLSVSPAPAEERHAAEDGLGIKQLLHEPDLITRYATSQMDTVWIGYEAGSRTAANPFGVDIGGVWDFDTEIESTDSTQFWQYFLLDWRFESTTALSTPLQRPRWYFDHGNEVNIGDTRLWLNRENRGLTAQNTGAAESAGYLRTGITGYWHRDDMSNVSSPISGSNSAWCGLRAPADFSYLDEVTGNPLNGDLTRYWGFGGHPIPGSWPGYGNQIDQILYHDVALAPGTNTLEFKFRTDMSDRAATEHNGSAWFNPEPTGLFNFILTPAPAGPIDSLMVWVGAISDVPYDINRRWLSEVLDFDNPDQPIKLFSQHGKAPLVGGDSTVTVSFDASDFDGAFGTVRLAFQVKTNRQYADETFNLHGFDSVDGAALIDDVVFNSVLIGDFESTDAIKPRYSLPGNGFFLQNDPATHWITTGKPPSSYAHVHNVFDLPYQDPCGFLGSPDRVCDLIDNILVLSNHDDLDHGYSRESWVGAESPTIPLYPGSDIQNVLDAQELDAFRIEYQLWTGEMDLDAAVFWNVGVRYHGPAYLQAGDEMNPGWSASITSPHMSFEPNGSCRVINSNTDLDEIIPPPSQLDSMKVFVWTQTRCARFGATVLCGKPEGGYFDNIRVGFTGGGGPRATGQFWDLLSDTFPFNETIAPGTFTFDTTTALIKTGINNASAAGGEGVIVGDTLVVTSAYAPSPGQSTRLDLLFRIKPGPGNYAVRGDTNSPLWRVPSDPGQGFATVGDGTFFGQYLQSPGPFGKGNHAGGWDPDTWNSVRMDSAETNLSPILERRVGTPMQDLWQATLHEDDPNYATLGIPHDRCFLVDPTASVDELNVCCSAVECAGPPWFETWPPSAYPGATPTSTMEGTKILADGMFTPGTHIEYIMRRSDAPTGFTAVSVTPDTSICYSQLALGPHTDGQRFLEFGVLPDLWKDARFGGEGLACMLVIDAGDRRGQEHAVRGALDSLGYGKNDGAGYGWHEDDPSMTNPDPNDADNWVSANLGQKGLSFDWFDINGAESLEGGRPGCRLALSPPALNGRQCKQGPTPEMLEFFYNTILWIADDLEAGVLHDGLDEQEQSDDVALIQWFLTSADPGMERAMYLAGDGAANDLATSFGPAPFLLTTQFGAVLNGSDFRSLSNNLETPTTVYNLRPGFQTGSQYGYNNSCLMSPDVISANAAVPSAVLAQRYEVIGPGIYGSAVFAPPALPRSYSTLISGYQVPNLLGVGHDNSTTDFGRLYWMHDALEVLEFCWPNGPVVAVGDMPGAQGVQLNFVRGAFPNPSVSGMAKVNFSLAWPAKVTFRFYNVAGRLVHQESVDYASGGPKVFGWNGQTSTGIRTSPGVYFYRLSAPGVEFQNNSQRMVLLGGN